MSNPQDSRVGVISIEGTNCEDESAQAFSSLGCDVEKVHLKQLVGEVEPSNCRNLSDYDALYFPGGFSSGDSVFLINFTGISIIILFPESILIKSMWIGSSDTTW